MQTAPYSVGQVVFIRTDTVDYAEETVPFQTLEELVRLCSDPRPNSVLEKVIIYSQIDRQPVAVTLGFVSASRGQRPGGLHPEELPHP